MTPRTMPAWPKKVYGWPDSLFSVSDAIRDGAELKDGMEVAEFFVFWNAWGIYGKAMYLGEQLVISELSLRVRPGFDVPAGGIASATLNLPLGQIRTDIARTFVQTVGNFSHSLASLMEEEAAAQPTRRGRKPYSDEEMRGIARLYLEVQREQGVNRIAEEMAQRVGENVSTINKKIRRATVRGFLGAASRGRGGRLPGPRLEASE